MPERCLVNLKYVIQMVSLNFLSNVFLQVYCGGHTGWKVEHFFVLIHFCLPSYIVYKKQETVYLKHNLHAKFKNSRQTGKWNTLQQPGCH